MWTSYCDTAVSPVRSSGYYCPMSERAVEEQWLELDGRQVHCCTLPPGPQGHERPPLLLIHGITCCIRTWEPFLRDLARRDDAPAVVVPDLPA
ncbi:MAG: hypothetical protein K0Q72_5235, partial [Armatimonadetes bacterium]|nr:hypothetical protein [Armatimonadota bacterium]